MGTLLTMGFSGRAVGALVLALVCSLGATAKAQEFLGPANEGAANRSLNERRALLQSQPLVEFGLVCEGECPDAASRRLSFEPWAFQSRWPMRITGVLGFGLLLAGGIASIVTGDERERGAASYLLGAGASTLAATGSAAGWRPGGADRGYLIFGAVASAVSLGAGTVLVAHNRTNWRAAGAGLLTGGVLQLGWFLGAVAHYRFARERFELRFAPAAGGALAQGRWRF